MKYCVTVTKESALAKIQNRNWKDETKTSQQNASPN